MHYQPTPDGRPVGAHSVANATRALELLASRARSSPELAEALGVDVRTARQLLRRLVAEGYLVQDGGHRRRYRPTLRLVALGSQVGARAALPQLARPALAALADRHRAAAILWVATGPEVVGIARADAGRRWDVELINANLAAPAAVLAPALRTAASSVYVSSPGRTCAAAVLDRGSVVAALGLSGPLGIEALADLSLEAKRVSAALAEVVATASKAVTAS